MEKKESLRYADAGVDVDAGNRAVELMKEKVRSTFRPEVMGDLGGFAGCFRLPKRAIQNPVLVSGTDGVGTKLKLAFETGIHHTVGQDLVAMCVNDILVQGAEPLFFLDYFACGKVEPEQVATVVGGIADGCRLAGCALIGGETAEMPGFYSVGEYDLAGFAVGLADEEKLIDGRTIKAGDWILGLPSSGVHSNGFSLVRRIAEKAGIQWNQPSPWAEKTWGQAFLEPTRIYVKIISPLLEQFSIEGMVHITGGGFQENIPRVLPNELDAVIYKGVWQIPPVFQWLQEQGNVEDYEMYRTFNMGIGFMLFVQPEVAPLILQELEAMGETVYHMGHVEKGDKKVRFLEEPLS